MAYCLICFEPCSRRYNGLCNCNYYVHNDCLNLWNCKYTRCIICGISNKREPESSDFQVYPHITNAIRLFLGLLFAFVIFDMIRAFYISLLTDIIYNI